MAALTTKRGLKVPVSGDIASLIPYPPGKPIEELERELGIKGSIKLASNENPLGPSRKAVEAVAGALNNLHRYPDGSCFYLKEKLAASLGISPDELILGNGSNEIIELLIRAYLRRGDEAVMADPSFAVYPIAVKSVGATAVTVPLREMRHDLREMASAVNKKTRLVFIANPNNPTGTIITSREFDGFMEAVPEECIVCVDEAYFEFVQSGGYPRTLEYVKAGRPVVLLRTFSKVYGLAGLRIGYGAAHPELVDYMNRVRQPFNVNSLAQTAAMAALDDSDHLKRTVENNREGLLYLYGALAALGFEYVPTEANFFLIKVGDGKKVYEDLLKKGVIVRPMAGYNMPEYIRVSVGLPEENRRFIEALSDAARTR